MKIQITTHIALEEQSRDYTRKLSHDERMAYLQKLIGITHSELDLFLLEEKFKIARIEINKMK